MPKVLTIRDVPPPPPTVDVTKMSDDEKGALSARISDHPSTWRYQGSRFPGVPWWIETVGPYFSAHETMVALNMSRSLFVAYHEAGRIPGAQWAYTARRQVKPQRVVLRQAYVQSAVLHGLDWFMRVDETTNPLFRSTIRRERPVRTRILHVTSAEFYGIADRSFRVPRDVAHAATFDPEGRCIAVVTFDQRGRVHHVSASHE